MISTLFQEWDNLPDSQRRLQSLSIRNFRDQSESWMGDARFERILGQLKALRLEFLTDSYERLGLIYNVYDYQLSNDSYKRLPSSRLGPASKN
jgi:hypothetical protein